MTGARSLSIAFQTDKTPAEYTALAQLVERYDFDVVSVYCDAPFHPSYGPLLLMAPHLSRARLGPAAVSPFRIHPIDIAAETALLTGLARGGVYLGLARGAWLGDYGILEPQQPVQALRETVEIVQGLLSGEFRGYEGKVYRIASHVRAPYPLPQERIPILIGTWGKRLAGLAGELADEVKVGGSANPDFAPVMLEYIRQGEERAGRPAGSVSLVMGAVCVVDEDRFLARQKAREAAALYLPVVAPLDPTLQVEPDLLKRLQKLVEAGQAKDAAGLISDELLDRFAFAGNPDDLVAQAEGLFAAGVGRIEFGTPHGLDSRTGIRLLGERVLPNLCAGG
jgi:5,10-methylenetetrahydromethanopterin reductase